MVRIRSSQKLFTEDEVSSLTGICLDHLHRLARTRHLGSLVLNAGRAITQPEQWQFTSSDLMILSVLYTRCTHEQPAAS